MSDEIDRCANDLQSPDQAIRLAAAEQLSHSGSAARAATVALVRAAGDSSEGVQEYAVAALEELGPPPVGQAGPLAELLPDQNSDIAYWAATLLGRLQAEAAPSVGALAEALAHSATAVRQRAAWALGKIGPAAAPAVPQLKTAAQSDDPRLARLAQEAIVAIEG